jgi:hypothetical protein
MRRLLPILACGFALLLAATPRMRRQCHHGPYELNGLTGFEIAPGGRHLYALESATDGTRGVGVVQLLRRD